jgi:pilus assembly protein CpaF
MEGDIVTMQDIFLFEQKGVDESGKIIGRLKPTGIRPKFYDRFEISGITLPPDLFAIY